MCSCNVISSSEIEAAVESLIAGDTDVMLTPGMVYRTIGCQPKCGTCLRHVVQLMHAHREALQAPGYLSPGEDNTPQAV